MNRPDLVRMANQIADFHAPYPAPEAEEGVARHIRDFCDPRMRAELAGILAAGGDGLSPLALAGARRAVASEAADA